MKKILVTGGAGFIGLAVVRRLAAMGVEVVVADSRSRPDRELNELAVRFLQGDVRDKKFVTEACRGCDTVFHLAAKKGIWGNPEDFLAVNLQGTRNVIEACLVNQVERLIHTSSARVVFTGNDVCGINEQSPCATRFSSHYVHSKLLAEKLVLEANTEQLRTTALRPALVWGPGDQDFIPWLVKQGAKGHLKKVGDGRNLVDICYVDNAAAAHLAAAASLEESGRAAGEAYFISQGEPVIFWNWVNKILRQLELPPVEEAVSFTRAYYTGLLLEWAHKLLRLPQEPPMTRFLAQTLARTQWFSIAKAERDLGYQPTVSTMEGLSRTVEWVRNSEE